MTYNVFDGTLSLTRSINQLFCLQWQMAVLCCSCRLMQSLVIGRQWSCHIHCR